MKHSKEPAFTPGQRVFERSCAYCGARLRVLTSPQPPGGGGGEYACPECGKRYEVAAQADPEVQLLHPRSDGKRDRYQETMF